METLPAAGPNDRAQLAFGSAAHPLNRNESQAFEGESSWDAFCGRR